MTKYCVTLYTTRTYTVEVEEPEGTESGQIIDDAYAALYQGKGNFITESCDESLACLDDIQIEEI